MASNAGIPCISYTLLQDINDVSPKTHYECYSSVINGITLNGITFYRNIVAATTSSQRTSSTSPILTQTSSDTATSRSSTSRNIPLTTSASPSATQGASSSSTLAAIAAPSNNSDSSLGVNTIVGIVFGALGLVVAIVTAWFSWRMWKAKKRRREISQT